MGDFLTNSSAHRAWSQPGVERQTVTTTELRVKLGNTLSRVLFTQDIKLRSDLAGIHSMGYCGAAD
jgi:hypothetical protein